MAKSFILSIKDEIEDTYTKYINTTNTKKIRIYLFQIMVIIYSLDTQHYFHAKSKGHKFKSILQSCTDLFDKIQEFAFDTKINITEFNTPVSRFNLTGEIDMINNKNEIYEIKCTSDITLKHLLQVIMYNIMYNKCDENKKDSNISTNFINFLKGELITINLILSKDKINRIIEIFTENLDPTTF